MANVGTKSAILKWDWAGHICRMHPEKSTCVTIWLTSHKCLRRGRPKKRWRNELNAFPKYWTVKAGERTIWKNIEETFAYNGIETVKKYKIAINFVYKKLITNILQSSRMNFTAIKRFCHP